MHQQILTTVMTHTHQDLSTIENTDLKVHMLHYANELLACIRLSFSKPFANLLNRQKQYKKMFGKSVMTHTLSIKVQTTLNHISFCILPQYQRRRKCFFPELELKKAFHFEVVTHTHHAPEN